MVTYILTMEQIKDIYRAGMNRGESEASAFDRGYSASGREYDNLEEVMCEILNCDKVWGQKDYVEYDEIRKLIGE